MTINIETDEYRMNHYIQKFTTNLSTGGGQDSILWTCPLGVTSVQYLIIGGGGGGGAPGSSICGGGGGAGGVLQGTVSVTPGQTYSIKVGAGGPANNAGSNSEFDSLIAYGGGHGLGGSGGSGGGGYYSNPGGGVCVAGQGNNGGNGNYYVGSTCRTGGGGGAGSVGASYPSSPTGGSGIYSDITNMNLLYATGGGGATGAGGDSSALNNAGGNPAPTPTPNTGAGGGGTGSYGIAAAGSNGIVILRYDANLYIRCTEIQTVVNRVA